MKIAIAADGILSLYRRTGYKAQICPYTHTTSVEDDDSGKWGCGDWCPMFREPVIVKGEVHLQLCKALIVCPKEDFTEGRVRPTGEN
jgi:hypothetical protein